MAFSASLPSVGLTPSLHKCLLNSFLLRKANVRLPTQPPFLSSLPGCRMPVGVQVGVPVHDIKTVP